MRWFRQGGNVEARSPGRLPVWWCGLLLVWAWAGGAPLRGAELNPYQAGLKAAASGKNEAAARDFGEAIALNLERFNAYLWRGSVRWRMHNLPAALDDFSAAARLEPQKQAPWRLRAEALYRVRDYHGAVAAYEHALPLQRHLGSIQNNLAWMLATCPDPAVRDGRRAVTLAREACQLRQWKDAFSLDTLAAAYAEIGSFEEAIRWENEAIARLPQSGAVDKQRARSLREHLERFRRYEAIRIIPL